MDPNPTGLTPYKRRLEPGHKQTVRQSYEDVVRRRPFASQGEASEETKPANTLILNFEPPEL